VPVGEVEHRLVDDRRRQVGRDLRLCEQPDLHVLASTAERSTARRDRSIFTLLRLTCRPVVGLALITKLCLGSSSRTRTGRSVGVLATVRR